MMFVLIQWEEDNTISIVPESKLLTPAKENSVCWVKYGDETHKATIKRKSGNKNVSTYNLTNCQHEF